MQSSSADAEKTSIWINRQRFGDIGGQRLGGFIGGLWANEGYEVMAWGWSGGWRRWRCEGETEQGLVETWAEVEAIGGHNGPVKGLDWSPKGEYLISAGYVYYQLIISIVILNLKSLDQTTRIHGPIPSKAADSIIRSWHELGRPQVHGYDLVGVTFLDTMKFISIADEKVARVFEAPRGFVNIVKGLGVSDLASDEVRIPHWVLILLNQTKNTSRAQDH